MTLEFAILLMQLAGMISSLTMELAPVNLTALRGLIALMVASPLGPATASSVFANEVIMILACIFVLAGTWA